MVRLESRRAVVTMLALWAAFAVSGSAQESRWVAELTARINANEPLGWSWVSVMPSGRPKLVPSETTVLLGIWEQHGFSTERVIVLAEIYQVANVSEAKQWLKRPPPSKDWRTSLYQVGDEGWLTEHDSGRARICFRRYLLVGCVDGPDRSLVGRFVHHIIAYFDAI